MNKIIFFLSIFLILPISIKCASLSEKKALTIAVPGTGHAGEKISLHTQTNVPLPASSFYRVEVECPDKPEGALVTGEMGYPVSDLLFSKEGSYTCVVSLGILSKSSCAAVQYKALGDRDFKIEILPK